MNKIEEAIDFALKAHAGTYRKGTRIPYILHPLESASICALMTDDEDIIAAAVLHDVIEDTAFSAADLKASFGERITALVGSNSENKRPEQPAEETWKIRKQETLNHLAHAPRDEKIVAFADKLSNLRASVNDYIAAGESFWERFRQKDPAEHLWYYTGVYEACTELGDSPLYTEYAGYLSILRTRIAESETRKL